MARYYVTGEIYVSECCGNGGYLLFYDTEAGDFLMSYDRSGCGGPLCDVYFSRGRLEGALPENLEQVLVPYLLWGWDLPPGLRVIEEEGLHDSTYHPGSHDFHRRVAEEARRRGVDEERSFDP